MRVEPARALVGHIGLPGDRSISHRALLIAAVADGETRIDGFGRSSETEATIAAVRALGAHVAEEDVDSLIVHGAGLRGLRQPDGPIDCRGARPLLALLTGLLVGQGARRFELLGGESPRARAIDRVAEPLRRMGARVKTAHGAAPVIVDGVEALTGIEHRVSYVSAQVKSAVLHAGLYARGRTTVVEPLQTRDHTERLLAEAGARVVQRPSSVSVHRAERLALTDVGIPGDFSAAAPFIVAATLLAGSELTVHGVGLNPTRTGLLEVLERMGARIAVFNRRRVNREPVGDVEVRSAPLVATTIEPDEVPRLVDELPLFALAASAARGESVVRGAHALRETGSDRIDAVTTSLRALGVRMAAGDDGFRVRGVPSRPRGGGVRASGDDQIAILGAVAGVWSREGVDVEGAEVAAVSFPGFFELLGSVSERG